MSSPYHPLDFNSLFQSIDPSLLSLADMDALTPSASSSASASGFDAIDNLAFDSMASTDKVQDWNDLFDFDHYDSASVSLFPTLALASCLHQSSSQSPKTVSPNQTPSPIPMNGVSPQVAAPSNDLLSQPDFADFDSFAFGMPAKSPAAGPAPKDDIVVKEEPLDIDFAAPANAAATLAAPPVQAPSPAYNFNNVTAEQQAMLQAALSLVLQYQTTGGLPQPTVEPSMIFNSGADAPSTTAPAPAPVASASSSTQPIATPVSAPSVTPASSAVTESTSDVLQNLDESQLKREIRQGSATSSFQDDIESRIEGLAPLSSIFSAGRGKGGKKGGGMSSVVRADDEDIDDDDSWRPSPEEYKKLSSKEKRQLRNKLSARAFRNRRKDYIGTLEAHIKDRDTVIDAIKSELVNTRTENQDLRRELAELKANAMSVIDPASAEQKSVPPSMLTAFSMSPLAVPESARPSLRRTPTPKINTRKDMPSTPSGMGFWGGNNNPLGGGGSTAVHTAFTPEIILPEGYEQVRPSRPAFADLPRVNLNPHLNDDSPRMAPLSSPANSKDMNSSFADWTENNAFSLRSMDSYRIQMWSRLAREAAADKANVPPQARPKFYVEAAYAQAAHSHISSKLASSFWSAFSSSSSGELDADKLAAIVTGTAKLKVVPAKEKDDADALASALGGLKLQSGLSRSEGNGLRVRENPLGALSSFLHSACAARV